MTNSSIDPTLPAKKVARLCHSVLPLALSKGFSMIELLVVIAIVALLSVLMIPSLGSLNQGFNITAAGQSVVDTFVLARQIAIAKNRNAEVRFYKKRTVGAESAFVGMQVWNQVQKNGMVVYEPATRVLWLKDGFKIIESSTYSPLLGQNFVGYKNSTDLPSGADYYVAVRFRSTGAPEAALDNKNNFVTVVAGRETGEAIPDNYFTIQIDPLTGRVATYRP